MRAAWEKLHPDACVFWNVRALAVGIDIALLHCTVVRKQLDDESGCYGEYVFIEFREAKDVVHHRGDVGVPVGDDAD